MIRIINKLDNTIRQKFPFIGQVMGLAEIITDETTKYPVTIGVRKKIAIDDNYDGLVYHRIISSTSTFNENFSYGLTLALQYTVTLRTFLAYRSDRGESFKYKFRSIFPGILRVDGFEFINISPGSIDDNHEGIMQQEFTQAPYHKHRLPWNIVTYDNTLDFVLCKHECLQNI